MVKYRYLEHGVVGSVGLIQRQRISTAQQDLCLGPDRCVIEAEIDADDLLGKAGVVVEHPAVADIEQSLHPNDLSIDGATHLAVGLQ
jgi:hypothetical protein